MIDFGKGCFQKVSDYDRHAPAGTNVAVGEDCYQAAAGRTMIRNSASHKKLQRPVHGYFSLIRPEPATLFLLTPRPIHKPKEVQGFDWRKGAWGLRNGFPE
jgi:hypothetical protein